MTDHARLLRQIHTEARPYVEQLVELNTVFTGFRKLATANGLDWGQIKALLRAEIEDGEEGGSEKVDRIIKKAEFAGEYAALLGLGSANMNNSNSISRANSWSRESEREFLASLDDGGIPSTDPDLAPLPPHDGETGELIEEPDAQHEATVETTSPMPEASPSPASSQEPRSRGSGAVQDRCESTAPPIPEDEAPRAERLTGADETAPVSGDAGETNVASAPNAGALVAAIGANASSNNSDPVTDDFPELPSFLKRSAA